ncbi:type V toxin-antitoxin system endoribonuclease antitoxin GhoS [Mixta calida]|uniref:type V toxin-antitoxin system endoribonuclease antitoxin GhoS n=1 Tax=Mixta calida TaxID=665913 RepID=UPI003CE901C9
MAPSGVTRYVVTFRYQDTGLAAGLALNSAMTGAGFSTTLHDDEGHAHELGTNSYGIISAKSAAEIRAQALGVGEATLEKPPEVEVQTFDEYRQQNRFKS